ncbi:MAB_1171c family putative transporter [Vallicoccus soli]|nr:MAB_1171c family putative transporter [Vallicoccus soli]
MAIVLAFLGRTAWQTRNQALRAMWLSFSCLTATLVLYHPDFYGWLDSASGVPNVREPLGRTTILLAGYFSQVMLVLLVRERGQRPGSVRRRQAALVCSVAVLLGAFVAGPQPEVENFTAAIGTGPAGLLYMGAFSAFMTYALVDVILLCRRYAQEAEPLLALGLRLIAAGCVLGATYVALKMAYVLARALGLQPYAVLEGAVAHVLSLTGLVLVVLGATLPYFGPAVSADRAVARLTAYAHTRRLYRLWYELQSRVPDIALEPALSALGDAARLTDPEFRLYRRVIEINDALLVLRRPEHAEWLPDPLRSGSADEQPDDLSHPSTSDVLEEARKLEAAAPSLLRALRGRSVGTPTTVRMPRSG